VLGFCYFIPSTGATSVVQLTNPCQSASYCIECGYFRSASKLCILMQEWTQKKKGDKASVPTYIEKRKSYTQLICNKLMPGFPHHKYPPNAKQQNRCRFRYSDPCAIFGCAKAHEMGSGMVLSRPPSGALGKSNEFAVSPARVIAY
jgi:hypothetical protein